MATRQRNNSHRYIIGLSKKHLSLSLRSFEGDFRKEIGLITEQQNNAEKFDS